MDHQQDIDMLLACARSRLNPQHTVQIKSLAQQDIDWNYVTRLAERHDITPLIFASLNLVCPEDIPPLILAQLRDDYLAAAQHNFALAGQLLWLMDLFAAHHIQAVPIKGPALTVFVYRELALRQFSDLDILVHRQQVEAARDLLIASGYVLSGTKAGERLAADEHHYNLAHATSGVVVELHWELAQKYYSFSFNPDGVWERLDTILLMGKPIPSLTAEDYLLILAVHGSKHGWEDLKWICDLNELIDAQPGIDWDLVLEQAYTLRSERSLLLGLCLAQMVLKTALPDVVTEKISKDPLVAALAQRVYRQLFRELSGPLGTLWLRLYHLTFQLQIQQGLHNKIRYFRYFITYWLIIPGPQDEAVLKLPSILGFLYSIFRPIRLIITYGVVGTGKFLKKRYSARRDVGI